MKFHPDTNRYNQVLFAAPRGRLPLGAWRMGGE